ncbi:glycosyltransferase family 2 protein [Mycobacteroides abscessus subsp. abscessus]
MLDPHRVSDSPAIGQVAVVTVTYSPGEHLHRFLRTLRHATDLPLRVILADNGSTDGAPEAYAEEPDVELLRTGGNVGYGKAANLGVAQVDPAAEWVVIANPDVQWGPGSIDAMLEVAQRWPAAGAVGPLIREPDGTVYPSARVVPTLTGGALHALLGSVWSTNPWTAAYRQDRMEPSERVVGWLSGSCLLLRRTAFDAIGGFDPRYFMYMEDVDLGDRLARAGWQNVYAPSSEVVHAKGHAAGRDPARSLGAHHDSVYIFQSDRHPHWWQAPLRWSIRGALAARSAIVVRAAIRANRRRDKQGG